MISIQGSWTMDPSNVWNPKSSFFNDDPFGISLHVVCSPDLVEERQLYDIQWQLVCPREDPHGRMWWTLLSGDIIDRSTKDVIFENQQFQYTNFVHWITWGRYSDAMGGVGAGGFPGVFAVRGHIQVRGSDQFDATDPYGFKYQLRGR